MDREALVAEFDIGDRLMWVERAGKRPFLLDRRTDYYLYDGTEPRGWWARRAQAAWWREWERNLRPRARLDASEEQNTRCSRRSGT
jgi:hypothetical protein